METRKSLQSVPRTTLSEYFQNRRECSGTWATLDVALPVVTNALAIGSTQAMDAFFLAAWFRGGLANFASLHLQALGCGESELYGANSTWTLTASDDSPNGTYHQSDVQWLM